MPEQKTPFEDIVYDYEQNFLPRSEILATLSIDEIVELFKNSEFAKQVQMIHNFRFYIRQLLIKSLSECEQNYRTVVEKLLALREYVDLYKNSQSRSLIAGLFLKYHTNALSDDDLKGMYNGHIVYDAWCAQAAYEELLSRRARLI